MLPSKLRLKPATGSSNSWFGGVLKLKAIGYKINIKRTRPSICPAPVTSAHKMFVEF